MGFNSAFKGLKVLNVSSVFIFNFCVFPYFLPYNCRYVYDSGIRWFWLYSLTLILLLWRIWWALNNASKWHMAFNSAFKGLNGITFFRCNQNIDASTTLVRSKSSSALYDQQLQVYIFFFFFLSPMLYFEAKFFQHTFSSFLTPENCCNCLKR